MKLLLLSLILVISASSTAADKHNLRAIEEDPSFEKAERSVERLAKQIEEFDTVVKSMNAFENTMTRAQDLFKNDLIAMGQTFSTLTDKMKLMAQDNNMMAQENDIKSAQYAMLDTLSQHAFFTANLADFKESKAQEKAFCQAFKSYASAQTKNLKTLRAAQENIEVETILLPFISDLESTCSAGNTVILKTSRLSRLLRLTGPFKRWIYAMKKKKSVRKEAFKITKRLESINPILVESSNISAFVQPVFLTSEERNIGQDSVSTFETIISNFTSLIRDIKGYDIDLSTMSSVMAIDLSSMTDSFARSLKKMKEFALENIRLEEEKLKSENISALKETHFKLTVALVTLEASDDDLNEAQYCQAYRDYSNEQEANLESYISRNNISPLTTTIASFVTELKNSCNNNIVSIDKENLNSFSTFVVNRDFDWSNEMVRVSYAEDKIVKIKEMALAVSNKLIRSK